MRSSIDAPEGQFALTGPWTRAATSQLLQRMHTDGLKGMGREISQRALSSSVFNE